MKTKGIYFLYRILQAFGLPVLLLYFLARGIRNPRYWGSLKQRFGFLPHSFKQTGPGAIWLHAVSMGEVLACLEFVRQVRREFPNSGVFVSTSTLAGRATAEEKLRGLAEVFYAPADYCFAVRRVLRTLRPSLVAVAETELWPNLFREVKRTGASLAIVNGRISDRALPRYEPRCWFFTRVLRHVDLLLAQNAVMADRFVAIGAPAERVFAAGNLKYDFEPKDLPADSPVRRFLEQTAPGSVWIAASTMPPAAPGDVDEDDAVLAAFRDLAARHRDLLLVLVPRKPERFDEAARKLEAAGLPFVRRTALPGKLQLPGVLLLDSIGELSGLFGMAHVVFMGGTLARRGGHNILEPAFFARPVVMGPHMENFEEIAGEFRAAGACLEIAGPGALAAAVDTLLTHRDRAETIGTKALACAVARRGSTGKAVRAMRELYDSRLPRYRPAWPWFPIAWLLAHVWTWGSKRRLRRMALGKRHLDVPVVSVGNLTMGGTGKTPTVLTLARAFAASGRRPGILTRGYGRSSTQQQLTVAPGAVVRVEQTGDEPQMFVRAAIAPVGIGGDRYTVGRMLEQQFGIDLALLDDGFQHIRLSRRVDLVLVDALTPFAGGNVFPLGRLREPMPALGRADIFLITRNGFSDLTPAIERTLRVWNERAPIFRGRLQPREWVEYANGKKLPAVAEFGPAAAFCGLGNPVSFRKTLENMGITPVYWIEFEDHHRYRPYELRRLANSAQAAGATVLLTTEKDALNLCDECTDLIAPTPLFWLSVAMEIEHAGEFLAAIQSRL